MWNHRNGGAIRRRHRLFGRGAFRGIFEAFIRRSARLSTTINILKNIANKREKALVFVEDIAMQEAVSAGLAASFDLDRNPAIINGATPGEQRLAIVENFENMTAIRCLILSPKATGVGLNIIVANHVIHLSRWWNPAVEDQCNDRVYRIGQTKNVTIHLPIPRIRSSRRDPSTNSLTGCWRGSAGCRETCWHRPLATAILRPCLKARSLRSVNQVSPERVGGSGMATVGPNS